MPAMVERVGHQSLAAEPRGDMVVAAGVFAEPMRKDRPLHAVSQSGVHTS